VAQLVALAHEREQRSPKALSRPSIVSKYALASGWSKNSTASGIPAQIVNRSAGAGMTHLITQSGLGD